jgi:hypothetical protein
MKNFSGTGKVYVCMYTKNYPAECIFIQHHNMLGLGLGARAGESSNRALLLRGLCSILYVNFREFLFYDVG